LKKRLEEILLWARVEASSVKQNGLGKLEKELRDKMLELGGRILESSLQEKCGTGYSGSRPVCAECGETGKFMNHRIKTMMTLVKQVELKRAYYYCKACGQGWFPLDEVMQVQGTIFSPGVREAICLVDLEIPFDRGQELLARLSGVQIHADEGRRLSEELGTELEQQTQQELENVWQVDKPDPRELPEVPERLYFSPDGTTILTEEGWKEVKVGAVFTAPVPKPGEDPVREATRVVATLEDADAFGKRLYVEGLKLGLGENPEVVVIADGAHWIWNEADKNLPQKRVEIIDFYHASEKLWTVARLAFGEENPHTQEWAQRQSRRLKGGYSRSVLKAIQNLQLRGKEPKAIQRQIIGYFKTNERRMRYREFRKKGYFIGSGVVESSCKHVVASRLKGAGMRWTKKGAQSILQLRLAWLNQRWDHLWLPMAA
jgi:hypothetical protein